MLNLFKKRIYPIGIDLGSGYLRMAQLGNDGQNIYLHAAGCVAKPQEIQAGSPEWQKWAVVQVKEIVKKNNFKGKKVITALPSDDLFIDQIKIPKTPGKKLDSAIFAKVSGKLPFDAKNASLRHVIVKEGGDMDILAMVSDNTQIARHLAIYENAGLEIQSICVWPITLINSFITFFSRRQEDSEKVSMLMDLGSNHSNIVICQQEDLLFARVVPIGFNQILEGSLIERLVSEIDACCRYFDTVGGGKAIELLMFLASRSVDQEICKRVAELAQRMQVAAQIGDVFSAVEKRTKCEELIDRRDSRINWATAFGLSLSG